MNNREKRCSRTHAQSHHRNRDDRKSRGAAQRTKSIFQIVADMSQRQERVLLPQRLANLLGVAQLYPRLSPRLVGRHSTRLVVSCLFSQKGLDLVLQLGVGAFAAKKSQPAHTAPPSSPITRPMARAICRHRLVSRTSCLRPSVVSR